MNLQEAKAYAAAHVHQRPDSAGRLGGKLAVVTGAAQGFGLGIAQELALEGAQVVVADMTVALAEKAALQIGRGALAIGVNVAEEASVEAMVCQAVEALGGIDLFVSNAGVLRAAPPGRDVRQGFFLCHQRQLHRLLSLRQIRQPNHAGPAPGGSQPVF